MSTQNETLAAMNQFGEHYQYDTSYMHSMHEKHPAAFEIFADFMPLASYRRDLPVHGFYVAKLVAMQVADCGTCLQLNIRMALEAGLDKSLVQAVIKGGELPDDLAMVYVFARTVAQHQVISNTLLAKMNKVYGETGMIELGLCIASAGVFPLIKRAMGLASSCVAVDLQV